MLWVLLRSPSWVKTTVMAKTYRKWTDRPLKFRPFVDLLAKVASIPQLKRLRFASNPRLTKPWQIFLLREKAGSYFHQVQSSDEISALWGVRSLWLSTWSEWSGWEWNAWYGNFHWFNRGIPIRNGRRLSGHWTWLKRQFCCSYAFISRKGTAAIRFKDQVPEAVKAERLVGLTNCKTKLPSPRTKLRLVRSKFLFFTSIKSQRSAGRTRPSDLLGGFEGSYWWVSHG